MYKQFTHKSPIPSFHPMLHPIHRVSHFCLPISPQNSYFWLASKHESMSEKKINVTSEIGTLKRLLIHSPDAGIGKIAPRLKDELLYDDIVYLDKMREEYDEYLQVLLWFLDPEILRNRDKKDREYFMPSGENYFNSDKVLDVENLLVKVLHNEKVKSLIVASTCAFEDLDFNTQNMLLSLDPYKLAKVLISGAMEIDNGNDELFLFGPVPNLIFTRDVGIVINDHLLLNKPAQEARSREALIIKYIVYYELFGEDYDPDSNTFTDRVIELADDEARFRTDEPSYVTIEGGDVMMVSPTHLFVGASERTSKKAIEKLIEVLFDKKLVEKVSVIAIPPKRSYMHIDTIFTQIRKDLWILFGQFSRQELDPEPGHGIVGSLTGAGETASRIKITQFSRIDRGDEYVVDRRNIPYLDDLFAEVSREFGSDKCEIIRSAGGEFPYNEREQWTDSCNFLALREGVIIGYDRNTMTADEFRKRGFNVITSGEVIKHMEAGNQLDDIIKGDTLILLPSSELSRARGGTHCMSMPLLRD